VATQNKTLEPFSINYLHDNPGARYTPKRLGRGPGSGKGSSSIYLEKHADEESKDRNHVQEVVLTFDSKVVKLLSKKDFQNTAE